MNRILLLVAAATLLLSPQAPAAPPPAGKLVFWGDDAFLRQMPSWAKGFKAEHPEIELSWFLKGSSTAIGALYTGTAQIGFLGREIRPLEIVSWKRIFPYPPLVMPVATGGFDVYNGTNSACVLVNAKNPLRGITLQQIDAIYSRDRKRGGAEPITRWGQLGLEGDWADKPIVVYGLFETTGTAQFLQARVLKEGRWSDNLQLPPGAPNRMYQGSGNDTAKRLEAALAANPYAMGLGTIRSVQPGVRALAVSETAGGPFVEDTAQTTLDRTYPLSRLVYVIVNKDPKKPWDPDVREFLAYLYSAKGQEAISRVGFYSPLPEKMLEQERAKLRD